MPRDVPQAAGGGRVALHQQRIAARNDALRRLRQAPELRLTFNDFRMIHRDKKPAPGP
jgi:hypothetical protein